MPSIAIVDSGPLLAVANRADPAHRACLEVLGDPDLEPVVPALCVAEVAYLLGRRAGTAAEARFLRGLADFDVQAPEREEWDAVAELVDRYADLPLGATDASVVVLARRFATDLVITLDRRHFSVVRALDGTVLRLLP